MACMGGARWAHLFCMPLYTFGCLGSLVMFDIFFGGKRKMGPPKTTYLENIGK